MTWNQCDLAHDYYMPMHTFIGQNNAIRLFRGGQSDGTGQFLHIHSLHCSIRDHKIENGHQLFEPTENRQVHLTCKFGRVHALCIMFLSYVIYAVRATIHICLDGNFELGKQRCSISLKWHCFAIGHVFVDLSPSHANESLTLSVLTLDIR